MWDPGGGSGAEGAERGEPGEQPAVCEGEGGVRKSGSESGGAGCEEGGRRRRKGGGLGPFSVRTALNAALGIAEPPHRRAVRDSDVCGAVG